MAVRTITSGINLIIATTAFTSIDILNIETIQFESSIQSCQSVSLKSGGDRLDRWAVSNLM